MARAHTLHPQPKFLKWAGLKILLNFIILYFIITLRFYQAVHIFLTSPFYRPLASLPSYDDFSISHRSSFSGAPTTFTRAGLWSLVLRPDRTGPAHSPGLDLSPAHSPLGGGVGEECCLLPSFLATFSWRLVQTRR